MKSARGFLYLVVAIHMLLMLSQVSKTVAALGLVVLLLSVWIPKGPRQLRVAGRSFQKDTLLEILGVLLALVVFAIYRQLFSIETSGSLIFLLFPLELARLQNRRSQWRFIFLWILSLSLILLEHQGLLVSLLVLIDAVLIFSVMARFEEGGAVFSKLGLRSALSFVVLSLPLWLVIFLLFPRFTVELWGVGSEKSGQIGFSDRIEPGHLGPLVANNEVALRVRYPGPRPAGTFHYFRGSTLEGGEGLQWWTESRRSSTQESAGSSNSDEIEQEIWMNQSLGRNLVALDLPDTIVLPGEDRATSAVERFDPNIFKLRQASRGPQRYRAWSNPIANPTAELSAESRARLTRLTPALKKSLQDWMNTEPLLSTSTVSAATKIENLKQFFRSQKFRYSLSPPTLATGGVLEFLQKTRIGFCEHFAASSATLLRAQGVPARVVVGFLGGRQDPFSNDDVVMNREAHAWIEYYDETAASWVRADPTLWIEPLRFEFGADLYWLAEDAREQLWSRGRDFLPWWPQFQERAQLAWDATFGSGERFLLSYQAAWLDATAEEYGVGEYAQSLALVFIVIVLVPLMLFLPRFRFVFEKRSLWDRFARRMGFKARPHLGEKTQWEEFLATCADRMSPAKEKTAARFVEAYLRHRYAATENPSVSRENAKRLEKLLRQIPSDTFKSGCSRVVRRIFRQDTPSRNSDPRL